MKTYWLWNLLAGTFRFTRRHALHPIDCRSSTDVHFFNVLPHFLRLADEVEQRTDVRKSGMQGFYANLLTKNVAMGGDVDAHAVSVYTAGSARQTHLLDTTAPPSAQTGNKETVQMEMEEESVEEEVLGVSSVYQDTRAAHGDRVGEKRAHTADTDVSDRAAEQPSKKQSVPLEAAEHLEDRRHGEVSEAPVTQRIPAEAASSAPSVLAPAVDKGELILSAKDRYLARKKAAAQGST
jgi:hypothetical protein